MNLAEIGLKTFCFGLLKFPTLAFVVSNESEFAGLQTLAPFDSNGCDEHAELFVDFSHTPPVDWPELTDNGSVRFFYNGTRGARHAISLR
jgi:hypothetical protein